MGGAIADYLGVRDENATVPAFGLPIELSEWSEGRFDYCPPAQRLEMSHGNSLITYYNNHGGGRSSCDCAPVRGRVLEPIVFSELVSRFCECADRQTPSPTSHDMNPVNSPYLYSWGACYFR